MAINNSVTKISPGLGMGILAQSLANALSTTSPQTTTITLTSGTATKGYVRARVYGPFTGTTPTFISVVVTGSDGTNTVTFAEFSPPVAIGLTASTQFVDWCHPFCVELMGTVTTGLVTFNFITTLGGTTPTAVGDFEVVYTT
jgi:hypothetical protein